MLQVDECSPNVSCHVAFEIPCVDAVPVKMGQFATTIVLSLDGAFVLMHGNLSLSKIMPPSLIPSLTSGTAMSLWEYPMLNLWS